jgi:hypothetical protein
VKDAHTFVAEGKYGSHNDSQKDILAQEVYGKENEHPDHERSEENNEEDVYAQGFHHEIRRGLA